jgi:diguanylate cyclase (GGDEF)-like protein
MRAVAALIVSVLAIAGAVLYASESQRSTAETNFREARVADQLRVDMLEEVRAANRFLNGGNHAALRAYVADGHALQERLRDAREVSADDQQELRLIEQQAEFEAAWRKGANTAIADPKNHAHIGGSRIVNHFLAANTGYSQRLDEMRRDEFAAAALVPVKLILGMSAIFGVAGGVMLRRSRRAAHLRREEEKTRLAAADRYRHQQARFTEAMQISRSVSEANELLVRHLERSIPDSSAVVLSKEPHSEVLELATPAPDGLVVDDADADSCLAIRFSRRQGRCTGETELFECGLCGRLDACASCEPLVVGGQVLGSVLLLHEDPLDDNQDRRLEESSAQAAPVLANLRNLEVAEMQAATDPLTGLPNKRSLDEALRRLIAQSERTGLPLSVVLIDLDHFKSVNDGFGHEMGDRVLAAFGAMLSAEQRASDIAARSGGEEFVVLLPATDDMGAMAVAEKLRVATHRLNVGGVSVTGSFGVATFPQHGPDAGRLLRLADRALYAAKHNGRDRVELAADPTVITVDSLTA